MIDLFCKICIEPYTVERLPLVLYCGHTICCSCESHLASKNCPICRSSYENPIRNYEVMEIMGNDESQNEIIKAYSTDRTIDEKLDSLNTLIDLVFKGLDLIKTNERIDDIAKCFYKTLFFNYDFPTVLTENLEDDKKALSKFKNVIKLHKTIGIHSSYIYFFNKNYKTTKDYCQKDWLICFKTISMLILTSIKHNI